MLLTFGEQLRQWRIEARINQRDLALRVGIDHTYLSKIENGRMVPPSETTIVKLAAELGQSADILLQLAQKVPMDVRPIISNSPGLPALLRSIGDFNDEELKRLAESAKEIREQRSSYGED